VFGLFAESPLVLLLFVGGVFGWFLLNHKQTGNAHVWQASSPRPDDEIQSDTQVVRQHRLLQKLERLRKLDPEFSVISFEDFLHALYAEAHVARGTGSLQKLATWLAPRARSVLLRLEAEAVEGVVIGAMRYLGVEGVASESSATSVSVEIEANYTERSTTGKSRRFYTREYWDLTRATSAKSKPPARARIFECPNCGAPLEAMQGRECSYCKRQVDTGAFDWRVESISIVSREHRPPGLGGHAEEQGTDLETVVHPKAARRFELLRKKDPELSWEGLQGRIETVFENLQIGWAEQDLSTVRPFVTDALFQSLSYWVTAYRRQKLRNVTSHTAIDAVQLCRVTSDAHFDSVTVRVFARGLDYTLDEADEVVGGSMSDERVYTEYWTLIRGAASRGASKPGCPSCGAPLEIEMSGHCKHCRAKVASGEFDWVLSRIEQDDSY
jgi:hypothetical protein